VAKFVKVFLLQGTKRGAKGMLEIHKFLSASISRFFDVSNSLEIREERSLLIQVGQMSSSWLLLLFFQQCKKKAPFKCQFQPTNQKVEQRKKRQKTKMMRRGIHRKKTWPKCSKSFCCCYDY